MEPDANTTQESSPELQVPDLAKLTPAELAKWDATGEMPQADPAPAADPKTTVKGNTTEGATTDPPTAETQEQYKAKTAKRIQQLLDANEADKRELARLRGVLQGAKIPDSPDGKPTETKAEEKPAERKMPLMDEFDTMQEWQLALAKYTQDLIEDGVSKKVAEREEQNAVKQAREQLATTFNTKVEAFEKEHPDFREVALSQDVPVTVFMGQIIMESPKTAELLYHLGQHPDEALRIAKLPEGQAARALFELERQFSGTQPKTETPPAKPVIQSRAPKPTSEIAGASSTTTDEAELALERQDFAAYERIMNGRQIAKMKG